MKTTNIRHQVFIREMIAHGNRIKAYLAAYPECKSAKNASNSAGRLLNNPDIYDAIFRITNATHEQELELARQQRADHLAVLKEQRLQLARIVRGEKVLPYIITRKGKPTVAYRSATVSQLLTAMKLDTELESEMQACGYQPLAPFPG